MLRRSLSFHVKGAATVAVGIALPSLLFSLIAAVVIDSMPVPDPDRTALVYFENARQTGVRFGTSGLTARAILERAEQIGEAAAISIVPGRRVITAEGMEASTAAYCTNSLVRLIGARIVAGRWFSQGDTLVRPSGAAVVSEHFWRQRLSGRADVIGLVLRVPYPVTIVGVVRDPPIIPLVFGRQPDVFLPVTSLTEWDRPSGSLFQLLVHVRGGVSLQVANSSIAAVSADRPGNDTGLARLISLESAVLGDKERTLWLLFGAATVIALMSAANLGCLITLRIDHRRPELGVRRAIGASQLQLVKALAGDLIWVLVFGCLGGLLAQLWGTEFLRRGSDWFHLPRLEELTFGPRQVVTSLLFSVA